MPIEKESETVRTTKETTWYECDVDECDVRSKWREDLNYVVTNPSHRKITAMPVTQSGSLQWDSVLILCDEHLEEFQRVVGEEFGVEFHPRNELILNPRSDHFQ